MIKITCIVLLMGTIFTVQGQSNDKTENPIIIDDVITSATRIPELKSQSAATVTIITRQEIQSLLQINPDLSHILGLIAPGMALSSNTTSNRSQTLRGRNMLVLIDGIPQSTPLRSTDRDIRSIDPAVIERIEIVKGATSVYGNGAIGGLMNIITQKLESDKPFGGTTSIGISDHQLFKESKAGGYRFNQQFYGKIKKFDYLVSGTINQTGSAIDGDNEFISPRYGLGDTKTLNLFAKLKYQISENQRIEAMYNYYSSIQLTNLISKNGKYLDSPSVGVIGSKNSEAIDEGTPKNHNFYAKYSYDNIWKGTNLEASLYYQNLYSVFDYRKHNPASPRWQETGGQATIKANKIGARVHLSSNVNISPNFTMSYIYGVDYLLDKTSQPLVDGRYWVPELKANNIAGYVQQKTIFYNHLVVKLGLRYDVINVNVPNYSVIPKRASDPTLNVNGGKLTYSKPSFNGALTYTKILEFQPYVSYSEGFSIFDLGRTLRDAKEDVLSKIQTEPVPTQNYEIGFNTHIGQNFKFTGAYFYSYSKLGSDLVSKDGFWVVDRSPQKVEGIELTADLLLNKYVSLGGTYTKMEGKKKKEGSKVYDSYMSGLSIPANKFTAFVILKPIDNLNVNFYSLLTGSRDRFEKVPNKSGDLVYREGEGIVKSINLYNLSASYNLKQVDFNLGVENLFNKTYYTATSMLSARNAEYVHGNGRYVNISIRYRY